VCWNYHAKLTDTELYKGYDFENLPAGVASMRNGYPHLVDGYHRRAAAKQQGLEEVWLFVAE